jgi:sulfofructose kinase
VLDAEEPVREAEAALAAASHIAFSAQGLPDGASDADVGQRLRQARAATGAFVCVTDGAEGVHHLDGDDTLVHTPAYAVDAVDTLGAGDTWHGAFALRLAEGAGEAEAIRFASAVAAIKCRRRGGRAGIPTRPETEAFMREREACR